MNCNYTLTNISLKTNVSSIFQNRKLNLDEPDSVLTLSNISLVCDADMQNLARDVTTVVAG